MGTLMVSRQNDDDEKRARRKRARFRADSLNPPVAVQLLNINRRLLRSEEQAMRIAIVAYCLILLIFLVWLSLHAELRDEPVRRQRSHQVALISSKADKHGSKATKPGSIDEERL
jgi:hypothetical protein